MDNYARKMIVECRQAEKMKLNIATNDFNKKLQTHEEMSQQRTPTTTIGMSSGKKLLE